MAKRRTGTGRGKHSHSHKTKKRLAIKAAMLETKRVKFHKKGHAKKVSKA